MKMNLYSLKDEHNGFAPPIPFANDEIAKRYFREMKAENITVKHSPQDFSIWYVGTFESETGLTTYNEPNNGILLIERG